MPRTGWIVAVVAMALTGAARAQGGRAFDAGAYAGTLWTLHDGLPQNTVYDLVQSRDGYLWFGTDSGLARFDGVEFVPFYTGNTGGGMRSNFVVAVYEASDGTLWLGTDGGVTRARGGRFETLTHEDGLPGDLVQDVAGAPDGTVWLATSDGVVGLRGDRLAVYTAREGLPSAAVYAVLVDRTGTVWAGTGAGLAYLDGGRFVPVYLEGGRHVVRALAEAPDGTLWAATDAGLVHYAGARTRRYTTHDGLASDDVQVVRVARDGAVWVGTDAPFVHRLAPGGALATVPTGEPGRRGGARALLEDREGNVWVGTYGYGLVRLRRKVITHLTEADGLVNNLVRPILPMRDGAVWVGTRGGAVHRLSGGRLTAHTLPEVATNSVYTLAEGHGGTVWAGVYGHGILRWDGERFVVIPALRVIAAPLALLEDRRGRLWIGTQAEGLWRRDPDGAVHRFGEEDGLPSTTVRVLVEDRDGTLWAGTDGGLVRIEEGAGGPASRVFTTADGLAEDAVYTIVEDADAAGTLWIGGDARLTRYRAGTFVPLDQPRMLVDDGRGFLWTRLNYSLYRVAKRDLNALADRRGDAVGGTSFGLEVGLEGEGVFGFSPPAARLRDGRLLFPTTQGVAVVDPDAIGPPSPPPPVYIERVEADTTLYERAAAPARFGPGLHRLVVHYAGLDFAAPARTRYRYRLDGFDEGWVDGGTRRAATYTGLQPGDYTFYVEAMNHAGAWSEAPARYAFTVQPHFAQTRLFRVLVAFAFVALGLGLYGVRARQLRRQEGVLREKVRLRTEALEREKARTEEALAAARAARATVEAQAEQLRALDAAKSRLFANLSHEFRTPLTLILGPLEQALRETAEGEDRAGLRIAHEQASRLLDLINQLLDLARLDAGRLPLRRTQTDLGALAARVAGSFDGLAAHRGIGLSVQTPEAPLVAAVDAAHVERVLTNLLANAFAHTGAGGKVAVTLTQGSAGGDGTPTAVLAVRDTGSGIPEPALPHLFDRFFRSEDEAGPVGTGIGLALARELVELHGGAIAVESQVGFGSTFTVTLPLGAPDLVVAGGEGTAPAPYVAPVAGEGGAPAPAGEGPRPVLLLVEDHAVLRSFLARALADAFEVVEAADGAEGLACARARRPAVVVSDVMMPRLDGFALTAALRADEALRETPVLLLTARADAEGEIEGMAAGADAYLAKPFSVPVLRAHLEALLDRRRDLRARYSRQVVVGPSEVVVTSEEAAFVERVRAEVETRLGDPHLSVEALAEVLAVSPRSLTRRMRALTGLSPAAFVRSMRLQRAAQLLAGRGGTVAEVAYAVGFQSVSHFTKRFKAEFGVPPSAYAPGGEA